MYDITSSTVTMPIVAYGSSTIGGPSYPRVLQSIETDVWNVINYGVDPTGANDASGGINTLAANAAGKTIRFPSGTYRCDHPVFFLDYTLVEVDSGARFTGTAGGAFNVFADQSVISLQQSTKVLARLSAHGGNTSTLHASQVIRTVGAATADYEKTALYTAVDTYDISTYDFGNVAYDAPILSFDASTIQTSATIITGNPAGRVWGITTTVRSLPPDGSAVSDGALVGMEVDVDNNSVAQGEQNRFNSKIGLSIVSQGTHAVTSAINVNNSGAAFFDGLTVVKSAVSRFAFVLRDLNAYPSLTPAYIDTLGQAQFRGLSIASDATVKATAPESPLMAAGSFKKGIHTETANFYGDGVITAAVGQAVLWTNGQSNAPSIQTENVSATNLAAGSHIIIRPGHPNGSDVGASQVQTYLYNPCSLTRFTIGGSLIERSYYAPTATSVIIPDNTLSVVIRASAAPAATTIALPPNPLDGQMLYVSTQVNLQAITWSTSRGTRALPGTLAAYTELKMQFQGDTWVRRSLG